MLHWLSNFWEPLVSGYFYIVSTRLGVQHHQGEGRVDAMSVVYRSESVSQGGWAQTTVYTLLVQCM